MPNNIYVTAAQGIDTEAFLDHIAWTDVIKPELEHQKSILSAKLVGSVLRQLGPMDETREQLAGKIIGIEFVMKLISDLVSKGRKAQEELSLNNIHIQ